MSADVDFVKIGKRIRNARKKCRMTQDEVARACNVTNNHISGVETGTQRPSLELFIKLGSVLGCGLDYFIADTLYAGKTYLIHLTQMLDEYHGIAPIVIIDEYDIPIQQGHTCGYYDQIITFIRNLFSGCLKDNKHLSYGFLTGILRVAKESIFSGLNNLCVNSILDEPYSEYFGFTAEEVRDLARYYGAEEKFDEICDWYDGYRFGDTEIFNPWSVINYLPQTQRQRMTVCTFAKIAQLWYNQGNSSCYTKPRR